AGAGAQGSVDSPNGAAANEADAVEADAVEADAVEADAVEADAVEADAVEAGAVGVSDRADISQPGECFAESVSGQPEVDVGDQEPPLAAAVETLAAKAVAIQAR